NSTMLFFATPSFHDGSGSAARAPAAGKATTTATRAAKMIFPVAVNFSPDGDLYLRRRHASSPSTTIDQQRVEKAARTAPRHYCLIIIRCASFSRSRYSVFSTVTPTPNIVPPLNFPGALYSLLTASPLSKPTHRPSPLNVNLPGWVFIGPCATS